MDFAKDKRRRKEYFMDHEQYKQNNTKRREAVLHDQEISQTIRKGEIEVISQ